MQCRRAFEKQFRGQIISQLDNGGHRLMVQIL